MQDTYRYADSQVFGDVELASNPASRTIAHLVIDNSGSMDHLLGALNTKLTSLKRWAVADALVRASLEIGVTTISDLRTTPPTSVESWEPEQYQPLGSTPIGAAVIRALDAVEERKKAYKSSGVGYYRPLVIILSDGLGNDDAGVSAEAASRVRDAETAKKAAVFAFMATDDPQPECTTGWTQLSRLSCRPVQLLPSWSFAEWFEWLKASIAVVSQSNGTPLALPAWTIS